MQWQSAILTQTGEDSLQQVCPFPFPSETSLSLDHSHVLLAVAASKCGAINTQLVAAADANAVLALVAKHQTTFNGVNAATALHRVAQHLKKSRAQRDRILRDDRFLSLVDAVVDQAGNCNPRSVSDILWACATLRYWPPQMLKPVLTQVCQRVRSNVYSDLCSHDVHAEPCTSLAARCPGLSPQQSFFTGGGAPPEGCV